MPVLALHEDKVFAGKKEEVAEFLRSFGLGPTDAEQVVKAVGTSAVIAT